ncbi:MAG: flagellar hook-length control protein FliK [Alphaproteobacteria bacterium]|nr:flagellar hook-length control protein FliK [Alphaproteobacteria bacterium]
MLMVGLIEDDAFDLPALLEDGEKALDARAGANLVAARSQPPLKPPPPYPGGPTAAQAAAVSELAEDLPQVELARRLLKGADGAIARQELMQIASLPDSRPEAERLADAKGPRWVFDLPFQTPQGVAVAQFEVSRDGGGGGAGGDRDIERTWRARFSLDVEPLGPVHVQIALTGVVARVGLWAERPDAIARLQAGEDALSLALRAAELTPEVAFHAGAPAITPIAVGRFVDRES